MATLSNRSEAYDRMEALKDHGATNEQILSHIMNNYLSGGEALAAIKDFEKEWDMM